MYITTKVVVTFQMPKEEELVRAFRRDNKLSQWREDITSCGITFTHVERYKADMKGEE